MMMPLWKGYPICANNNSFLWRHTSGQFSIKAASAATSSDSSSSSGKSFAAERVPLDSIFNQERNYLFATHSNIRDFEWTEKEAEDIYESILSLLLDENSDDLELGTIVLMRKRTQDDKKRKIGKASRVYDVHDGQQRIVTISLFLAALRDCFIQWNCENDAKIVASRIHPTKPRHDNITRIELREKNGKYLRCILANEDMNGNTPEPNVQKKVIPKKSEWKHFTPYVQRIFEVYTYFLDRIKDLGEEKAAELYDIFLGATFLTVMETPDASMARKFVMGQGKGKNLEPVDVFKGIVFFDRNDNEQDQDQTLEKWNELSEEVGRTTLETACLLIAKAWRGKTMRKNEEIDYMERFVKEYTIINNQNGQNFFDEMVFPAAKVWREFQDGHIILSGKIETQPSLLFLASASGIPIAADIGIVALHFLVELKKCNNVHQKETIQGRLRELERIALWMMLIKPKPEIRLNRCIQIINGSSDDYSGLNISYEEKNAIRDVLQTHNFGATNMEIRKAKAILARINEYILTTENQHSMPRHSGSTLHVEHILPQKYGKNPYWKEKWDQDDAEFWLHKIGNLALLNEKVNSSIGNSGFEAKQKLLSKCTYPLTKDASNQEAWTPQTVEFQHKKIIQYASDIWLT